jgi:hypothetical protein
MSGGSGSVGQAASVCVRGRFRSCRGWFRRLREGQPGRPEAERLDRMFVERAGLCRARCSWFGWPVRQWLCLCLAHLWARPGLLLVLESGLEAPQRGRCGCGSCRRDPSLAVWMTL